jgi:hypothetical protein
VSVINPGLGQLVDRIRDLGWDFDGEASVEVLLD